MFRPMKISGRRVNISVSGQARSRYTVDYVDIAVFLVKCFIVNEKLSPTVFWHTKNDFRALWLPTRKEGEGERNDCD